MAHWQTEEFTVIATPTHMQAGDNELRPIAVLFDDAHLGSVAELKLTPKQAEMLRDCLSRALVEAS